MRPLLVAFVILVPFPTAQGQGTVNFINIYGPVNAPFYESDRITKLAGPQFMAQLLAGPSASTLASIAMTGFFSGGGAGYFNGGEQYINSVPPGSTAWVQVDVWNTASGATFSQAQGSGLPNSWWQSSVFAVQTGNPFSSGGGPTSPAALTGLGNSPLYLNSVPEPSTIALAGLAAAAVVLRIDRRNCSRVSRA